MNDSLVRLLNSLGYQPIFLAKTDVEPVDVYTFTADRRLIRRGPFSDYSPAASLAAGPSTPRPSIAHTETSSKRMGGAAAFLKAALQAIGVQGNAEVNLGFAAGSNLVFSFEEVTARRVDPSRIDAVIEGAEFPGIPEPVLAAGRVHLVYEYLYSPRLVMRKEDHSRFDASAEAAIESLATANISAEVERERMSEIRFAGTQPAAFAYKAGQLERSENGRWYFYPEEVVFRRIESRRLFMATAEAVFPTMTVPYSNDLDRVLPLLEPEVFPERRPYLPAEGLVLTVESE